MARKNKRRVYKDPVRLGGFGSIADGRYNPESRLDPETQELKSDPFAYGRKKNNLTPEQNKLLHKQRSKNASRYGVGAVTGAGSMVGTPRKNETFTIVNAPPKKSENALSRERALTQPYISILSKVLSKSKIKKGKNNV